MTRNSLTHILVVCLGLLYILAGIAETVRLVRSGDGGLAFWFGSLVGGGSLLLAGEAIHRLRPGPAAVLIGSGCLAGVVATIWTLVVPILALVVFVLALKRMDEQQTAASLPGESAPPS